MQSDSLPPADSEQERAAPSSGAGLENSVQLMDFGNGETVYITAGHVDLVTLIRRGGGVGSTWAYIPGQVLHCWLEPMGQGGFLFSGEEQPSPSGIPITVALEPDNMPEVFRRPPAN